MTDEEVKKYREIMEYVNGWYGPRSLRPVAADVADLVRRVRHLFPQNISPLPPADVLEAVREINVSTNIYTASSNARTLADYILSIIPSEPTPLEALETLEGMALYSCGPENIEKEIEIIKKAITNP